MALLEAMQNYDDLFNIMVYQTLNATNSQYTCNNIGIIDSSCIPEKPQNLNGEPSSATLQQSPCQTRARANQRGNLGVQGKKKKRRRRPKVCKNREDAETQRMTHIAVERNRRKQMNEHLAVLRSLMPESYSQRGDQASIVGGAIEFVKELEHLVHSLEAQKLLISQRSETPDNCSSITTPNTTLLAPHFPDVFSDHQHRVTQNNGSKFTLKSQAPLADVEVTLIETHANLRILSKKNPRQLSKLVSGFQAFRLSILHLSVTTLDSLVLYSISVKVEEGCLLNSVDSIAEAVHHMLRIIEEDVSSLLLTY